MNGASTILPPTVKAPLSDPALNQIFREARTHNGWVDEPLPEGTIERIYDLAKFGATSANISPARFFWVVSSAAKEKLAALATPLVLESSRELRDRLDRAHLVVRPHDADQRHRTRVVIDGGPQRI